MEAFLAIACEQVPLANGTVVELNLDCAATGSCCDNGKPVQLTMRYLAEDCAATSHSQDPGKVECTDFGALPATVFILATDKEDPFSSKAKEWFSGDVSDGQLYSIDAGNAGETKLSTNTFIHIFDVEGGTLLQKVKFHTSCSQPLLIGDQFGASVIVNCVGEDDPSVLLGNCFSLPVGDALLVRAEFAVLVVTVVDEEGNERTCHLDLCAECQ